MQAVVHDGHEPESLMPQETVLNPGILSSTRGSHPDLFSLDLVLLILRLSAPNFA